MIKTDNNRSLMCFHPFYLKPYRSPYHLLQVVLNSESPFPRMESKSGYLITYSFLSNHLLPMLVEAQVNLPQTTSKPHPYSEWRLNTPVHHGNQPPPPVSMMGILASDWNNILIEKFAKTSWVKL